ncbi:MAG: glycosyltransferase family 25 protein [Luteolibacter sp.]
MNFGIYLINLDRATERMAQMDEQLSVLDLAYTRISAVLGSALPEPVEGFDQSAFTIRTGKHRNPGEIGCYFSHLKAMETFLESDHSHALILEDDAQLPEYLSELLEAAIGMGNVWDLLRLSSSREGRYLTLAELPHGHQLVINTKVLKNTAAYLINRAGAQQCLKHLRPMKLPYDVALDRDWTMGVKTACIHPFPIGLTEAPGQIPKAPRARLLRATTFHLFHLIDRFRRKCYRNKLACESRDLL